MISFSVSLRSVKMLVVHHLLGFISLVRLCSHVISVELRRSLNLPLLDPHKLMNYFIFAVHNSSRIRI